MTERRYFTVAEAEQLLPELEQRLLRAIRLRGQLRVACQHLEDLGEPPTAESLAREDGMPELRSARGRFRALVETLTDDVHAVEGLGISIKDLDTGLCDFLGQREGRDVWICWRLGEKRITHWHELDAGFSGRQPLDGGLRAAFDAPRTLH